jgi:hypothetical protein
MHRKMSTHLSASYKEFKNNATDRNQCAFDARAHAAYRPLFRRDVLRALPIRDVVARWCWERMRRVCRSGEAVCASSRAAPTASAGDAVSRSRERPIGAAAGLA